MDRKAWIIIVVCLGLLGLNFYYQQEAQERAAKEKAAAAAAGLDQIPAATAPVEDQPSAQPVLDLQAALVVPPTPINENVQTWELVSMEEGTNGSHKPAAKFVITNIGGAIKSVEMMGQQINSQHVKDADVTINEECSYGIGSLVFGMNDQADLMFDRIVYTKNESASTDRTIVLQGRTENGLLVSKTYTLDTQDGSKKLHGDKYMVKMKIIVRNDTGAPISLGQTGVFAGAAYPISKSETQDAFTHYFYYSNGNFEQQSPSHFKGGFFSQPKAREVGTVENLTYAGVMSQYYVTALIPDQDSRGSKIYAQSGQFRLSHEEGSEVSGVMMAVGAPNVILAPGEHKVLSYELYIGPKLNQVMGELPYGLHKVMGYGWFTILSEPMNWLLNFFHGWFDNWGWAIIGMTIVVRLLIWPLHKKSYLSMKRMSLMQPKMQELKEKYANDQQKVNAEMMKLYQEYGINPVGGCLPLLIQMPIFFSFYRVLQYSAELRGQPFYGWVTDLSLPDTVYMLHIAGWNVPINVLPIVMALTMVIQMKMTPQAGDKMQQRIMMFMPLMFFVFCYNFASALALYWTVQNILTMGQTWFLRKLPIPELMKKTKKKKGFMQRMMAQAEQQQKATKQHGHGKFSQASTNMRNVTPKK